MWQAILCSLGPRPRSTCALQKGLATPEGFGHPRRVWSPLESHCPGHPCCLTTRSPPSTSHLGNTLHHWHRVWLQQHCMGRHLWGSPRTPTLPGHGAARPGDALTMGVGSLGVLVGSPSVLVGSPGVRVGSLGVRDAVLVSPTSRGAGLQRVNS